MISVLSYPHYREFLKDFYLDQKRKKTGFTYARFSSAAGLGSPNYYKLVMDGEKNLTPENIARFARALKLSDTESDYFEALVHFNQAKDPLEKEYYQNRLKRVKKRLKPGSDRTLEEYEFEAISHWAYHAILVLTNVKGFRESPAWIRDRLFQLVSEEEVATILERLIELKLLVRNEDGKLIQSYRDIKTKAELRRLSVQIFYEGYLARATQAMKLSGPESREYGASFVSISPKQVPELKRRVREFMKTLYDWAVENPAPTQVYALSFFGFPISAEELRPQVLHAVEKRTLL